MILPETKKAQALSLVAKIAESVTRCKMPWAQGGFPQKISLSVGIASYPDEAQDALSLIASADAELYQRKQKDIKK